MWVSSHHVQKNKVWHLHYYFDVFNIPTDSVGRQAGYVNVGVDTTQKTKARRKFNWTRSWRKSPIGHRSVIGQVLPGAPFLWNAFILLFSRGQEVSAGWQTICLARDLARRHQTTRRLKTTVKHSKWVAAAYSTCRTNKPVFQRAEKFTRSSQSKSFSTTSMAGRNTL